MGATAIISIVLTAIDTLTKIYPQLKQTGTDLMPFGEALYNKLTGQAISDDQRTAMQAGIQALFDRLEAPLPAAQPGDPDYAPPAS